MCMGRMIGLQEAIMTEPKHIGIVGGGLMGAGIAEVAGAMRVGVLDLHGCDPLLKTGRGANADLVQRQL